MWEYAGVRICKCISQCACFNTECTLFSMAIGQNKGVDSLMLLNPTWICNMVKFCFSSCCIYPWRVQSTCLQYLNVSILITHLSLLFIPRDIVTVSTTFILAHNRFWKKPDLEKNPDLNQNLEKNRFLLVFFKILVFLRSLQNSDNLP